MPSKKYSLILADPPWSYGNTISNGAAENHYGTMKLIDIKRLPVWELAAENAVLAMWYTGTHNEEAIELAEAWGFTVRTMKGFTWVKLNQLAEVRINKALAEGEVADFYDFLDLLNAETRMNGGNHTRANSEDCLFAVRGKLPARMDASICQHVTAPRLENSRKPDVIREKLVQLLGDVPRIELFARQSSHGFDVWGNQCEGPAVQLHPGYALDIAGLTRAFGNAPMSPTDNQVRERAA
ncbi:MT-A70 family methyltransferase [Enterobacter hormaechei]|uniref:MT-A70 family methyltransferase n=1 Tax=Enterobacter hormaechei TaxID=158836 RepID=UPI000F820AB8|nr:MT-A70 family methyltransferase [Enterobacter hormaechei]RTQ12862.1 DNA methyltransferase [Enterobacter hormaechei]